MKKMMLLLLVLILLSGCEVSRIDNYDYKQLMDKVLTFDINYYNKVGKGYKYYSPKGVIRINSNDYNDVLKRNDNVYYLFVDVVSYYYKTNVDYKIDSSLYYSNEINKGNKKGYIQINQVGNNQLFIEMVYNYAKIETYTKEENLKQVVVDISYILSSIDFNDSLLKKMYEQGNLDSKDEVYKLFENKEKEGNFLEYIKEYDKYEQEETKEEHILEEVITTTTKEEETTTKKEETEITTTKENNITQSE